MKKTVDIIHQARSSMMNLMEKFSLDQLNEIPEGFNNNLVWNLGHIIVSQQLLCYGASGIPPLVDQGLIGKYRSGTRPEGVVGEAEYKMLTGLMISLIDQFQKDLEAGKFSVYQPVDIKSFPGLRLECIEDAVSFDLLHEGLHLGYCRALVKNLKK